MQTVHGVPLPIYRGFQLLADAGDKVLPITSGGKAYNQVRIPAVNSGITPCYVYSS